MSQGPAAVSLRHAGGGDSPLTLLRQGIVDVRSRVGLIRYLVQAEMKKRGSDTVLGNIWWVLDPLLQMSVYWIFVSIIARRPAPDYPLFIFAALLPWKWYASVVNDATNAVVKHDKLIRQIAFPKLVLPVSAASAGVVGFMWGLIPLGLLMLFYLDRVQPVMLVWIPLIAAVQYVFALASAILVSAANVFFRDIGNAIGHGLRLWWFLSPGLYSLQDVRATAVVQDFPIIGTLAALNPFAILFESYRAVIYGGGDGTTPPHPPDLVPLFLLFVVSLVFLTVALVVFKRVEPEFAKVL
jgi:ABC-type polysaccharide/polyol phosphate export permease